MSLHCTILKYIFIDKQTAEKQLRSAANSNDYEAVVRALEKGVNVNAFDERKRTALHFASCNGNFAIGMLWAKKLMHLKYLFSIFLFPTFWWTSLCPTGPRRQSESAGRYWKYASSPRRVLFQAGHCHSAAEERRQLQHRRQQRTDATAASQVKVGPHVEELENTANGEPEAGVNEDFHYAGHLLW